MVVGLALIAVLSAVVYPVVIQQISKLQALRVANDLRQIAQGVRAFEANVGTFPGDLDDLANPIDDNDRNSANVAYSGGRQLQWFGPYIDRSFLQGNQVSGNAVLTGFGAQIQQEIRCFHAHFNVEISCAKMADVFVAIKLERAGRGVREGE